MYFYQIAVSETREELDRVEDGITDGLIGTVLGLYAFTVCFDLDECCKEVEAYRFRNISTIAFNRKCNAAASLLCCTSVV